MDRKEVKELRDAIRQALEPNKALIGDYLPEIVDNVANAVIKVMEKKP